MRIHLLLGKYNMVKLRGINKLNDACFISIPSDPTPHKGTQQHDTEPSATPGKIMCWRGNNLEKECKIHGN